MKLSSKLIVLFLLIGLVPVTVVSILAYRNSVQSLTSEAYEHVGTVSELKEAELRRWLESTTLLIETIAKRPTFRELAAEMSGVAGLPSTGDVTHEIRSSHLAPHLAAGLIEHLSLLDPASGRVLVSTDDAMAGRFRESESYFIKGKTGTSVDRVSYSVSRQSLVMHISTPVATSNGELAAVLVAQVDLGGLSDIIGVDAQQSASGTEDVYLVNDTSFFVTMPRFGDEGDVLRRRAGSEGVEAALRGETGIDTYEDYRGVMVIGAYRWLSDLSMALIAEVDRSEALASAAKLRTMAILLALVAAAGVVLAAGLFARQITRPIQRLMQGAKEIGQGNLAHRVPEVRRDELGVLAEAFNGMTENLQRITASRDDLNREIESRRLAEERQREQWDRFTSILNNFPDIVYVIDPDTYEILFVNRELVNLLGRDPTGERCYEALHGFKAPCEFCPERAALEKEKYHTWEHENLQLGIHFLSTCRAIQWPDGRSVRLEVAKDITPHVQVQKERDRALAENVAIIESMRDGLAMIAMDGRVVDVNPAFERMSGYAKDEILSAQKFELLHKLFSPEDAQLYIDALTSVARGEIPEPCQITMKSATGTEYALDVAASMLKGPDEDGILISLRDVTPRMQAERALRMSEQKYRALFENSQIGIFRSTVDGQRILDVNPRLCEIFERDEEDLLQLAPPELWANPAEREEIVRRLVQEGRIAEFEAEFVTSSGTRKTILGSMTLYPEESVIEGSMTDITEWRASQRMVEKMNDDLLRSNQELEQFAYVASHDLQEPLRMVSSYTQLLAKRYESALDQDAKDFIGYAVDGAQRMQRLINDLLAYSRVQTRGREFEEIDLNHVLGEARANVHASIEENGAFVIHRDLPMVRADQRQMVSVFQNLISNAIKFRKDNAPRIEIWSDEFDEFWRISVRDNGIGIEAEYRDRVFVIFQRLHARSEYPGTGIGLALVRRIIERHGGQVWFESDPGEGTTFQFTLPKRDESKGEA